MRSRIFESKRLYLSEYTKTDAQLLLELNSDPDVMKYIGPPRVDIKVAEESIKKLIAYYSENPGLGVWAAFEKDTDEYIGFFELAHLDNTEEIEVGYRLHKKYWGKGYATEMSKVLIDYGFNKLGLNEIAGVTHPENIASQNVLLKCGLRYVKDAVFYGFLDKYYIIENPKRSKK